MTTVDEAKTVLQEAGILVVEENEIQHGTQIRGDGGQIISIYNTGRIVLQGKNTETLEKKFSTTSGTRGSLPPTAAAPTNVFIVYGHNEVAKNETERMLRKWNLNPIMLDQIPAEGLTLIEKLEKYIQQAPFAVVLATADDVYLTDSDDGTQKEFRARQNVVLELGMMLVHLGRSNVAILFEDKVGMKKPSDIDGLEYLSFKDDVSETRVKLAQMMAKRGYAIDIVAL